MRRISIVTEPTEPSDQDMLDRFAEKVQGARSGLTTQGRRIALLGAVAVGVFSLVILFVLAPQSQKTADRSRTTQQQVQTTKTQAQEAQKTADQAKKQANVLLDCLNAKTTKQQSRCLQKALNLRPGAQGAAGRDGSQGPQGRVGNQGPQGVRGRQGPPGKTVTGPQGPPGEGVTGPQGPPGKDGKDGTGYDCKGDPVTSGNPPAKCPGAPGRDGKDGSDGAPGAQGAPGAAAPPPTQEQVNAAVAAYCAANPGACVPAAAAP
jgi:hypothetical protein